jgi:hypothetical protein
MKSLPNLATLAAFPSLRSYHNPYLVEGFPQAAKSCGNQNIRQRSLLPSWLKNSSKSIGSLALTFSVGAWLISSADAQSSHQVESTNQLPSREDFKTRLPNQQVSNQGNIAAVNTATVKFASSNIDKSISRTSWATNSELKKRPAASPLPKRNVSNIPTLIARLPTLATPIFADQTSQLLDPNVADLPPPPPALISVNVQGENLRDQQPKPTAEQSARPFEEKPAQPHRAAISSTDSKFQPTFSPSKNSHLASFEKPTEDFLITIASSSNSSPEMTTKVLTIQEFLKLSSLSFSESKNKSTSSRLSGSVTQLPLDQYYQYWQRVNERNTQITQPTPTFGFIDFKRSLVVLPESIAPLSRGFRRASINPSSS